jgi:Calcineurin-like phosphoesterase superfamily domain
VRIAVITDIHGNRQALEAIIEDLAHQDVDEIVMAGDTVNMLPNSGRCWQMVRTLTKNVIKGNHEFLTHDFQELLIQDSVYSSDRFAPLRACVAQFSVEDLDQMRELPSTLHYPDLLLTHATPRNLFESINKDTTPEQLREMFTDSSEPFIVRGHNHVFLEQRFDHHGDARAVTTLGSAGIPLDGDTRTRYGILTRTKSWRLEERFLNYDHAGLLVQMGDDYLETHGGLGLIIREEIITAELHLYPFFRQYLEAVDAGEISLWDAAKKYLES